MVEHALFDHDSCISCGVTGAEIGKENLIWDYNPWTKHGAHHCFICLLLRQHPEWEAIYLSLKKRIIAYKKEGKLYGFENDSSEGVPSLRGS